MIRSTIFVHKTTATTRTVYFSKIRRIGFRRTGTEPPLQALCISLTAIPLS